MAMIPKYVKINIDGCTIELEPIYEDLAPVRHGKWAYIGGDEWCCTQCGYVTSTEGRWEPMMDNFCSNCGAKMDLKDG